MSSTHRTATNNGSILWTEQERQLLYDPELTDQEISNITGRSLSAIKNKRYRDMGDFPDDAKRKAMENEIRILKLAEKMNIKLAYGC